MKVEAEKKTKLKITLIIVYYDQLDLWPHMWRSIQGQTKQPDEIILAIDHSVQTAPVVPKHVKIARSPSEYDGGYSRGAALNAAIETATGDVIVTTDCDCFVSPKFIESYHKLFNGEICYWPYYSWTEGIGHYVPKDIDKEIYIGDRLFLTEDTLLDNKDYTALREAAHAFGGSYRGRPDGTAAVQGCNMAFMRKVWLERKFPEDGRCEDCRWFKAFKGKYTAHPAPEVAKVLHLGPTGEGRGLVPPVIHKGVVINPDMLHVAGYRPDGERPYGLIDAVAAELKPVNILDVGCGPCAAMLRFKGHGAKCTGIDGDPQLVRHRQAKGFPLYIVDLEKAWVCFAEKYDLVWSYECAEHIEHADNFVKTLTLNASHWIVMSHATPGSGGHHHVNSQLREYWIDRIIPRGFVLREDLTEKFKAANVGDKYPYFKRGGLVFEKVKNE